ncbi:MAG: transposase domain-containing protein, partial [Peptoanaerobacter stomatis]
MADDNILLTVDEACKLEDKKKRNLLMSITRGSLKAEKIKTNRGCGFEYRIDLRDLSETAKVKYYASQKKNIDKYDYREKTGDEVHRKARERETDKSCRDININETDNDRK